MLYGQEHAKTQTKNGTAGQGARAGADALDDKIPDEGLCEGEASAVEKEEEEEDIADIGSGDSMLLARLAKKHGPLVLLACTQRSEETFAYLQRALKAMRPRYRDLTGWAHSFEPMLPIQRNRGAIHFYCIYN